MSTDGFTTEQMRLIEITAELAAQKAVDKAVEHHIRTCPLADRVELRAWRGFGKLMLVVIGSSGFCGAISAWVMSHLVKK